MIMQIKLVVVVCLGAGCMSDTRPVVFSSSSSHIRARSLRLVTMATQDYNQKAELYCFFAVSPSSLNRNFKIQRRGRKRERQKNNRFY